MIEEARNIMTTKYTTDYLRTLGVEPFFFGLGFIQLKISKDERIHFWHPSLSGAEYEDEIHDHRYDFVSTVLKGALVHETYEYHEFNNPFAAPYVMAQTDCTPDNDNMILGYGDIRNTGCYTMTEGSKYFFSNTSFHRAYPALGPVGAVTLLERFQEKRSHARVIRPKDKANCLCPFAKKIPVDELWQMIDDMLSGGVTKEETKSPGYHLKEIDKGVVGEPSKIYEECAEFRDAIEQNVSVMALVELSDLYGAIRQYLEKYHPSVSMEDLAQMNNVTVRAFVNGKR